MSLPPEFSRPVRIDGLGPEPRRIVLAAEEVERAALARRFGLLALGRLEAEAAVNRDDETVIAAGRLSAEVTQSCVATGDPLDARITEDFRIEFRPPPEGEAGEEVELDETEMDVVFHDRVTIDLGEALAETLLLALDAYPRSAEADEAMRTVGVKGEEEARAASSPFAALAGLRDKMGE